MLRTFCLLLLGLLFLTNSGVPDGAESLASVAMEPPATVDCCPEASDAGEEDCDCCAYDFGTCCSTAVVAGMSTSPVLHTLRSGVDEAPHRLAPHLQYPQTTGPPPTPPPIV